MSNEIESETIDEKFLAITQSNVQSVNFKVFKEIADLYLCKHGIPYTRDTSGSSIVYRCPFLKNCTFCIRGGISRSKDFSKKGLLSVKSICLQHSCKWKDVPRENRRTRYRPTYRNRIEPSKSKERDSLSLSGIPSYIDLHEKPILEGHSDIPLLSSIPMEKVQSKFSKKIEMKQSTRPMYCRNAYTQCVVRKLVQQNPYISLRTILSVLESRRIEFKEVTVARYRRDERARYLTPIKQMVKSLKQIKDQILAQYPKDEIEIVTTIVDKKEELVLMYVCPEISHVIFQESLKELFVDCLPLRNESGGVLFVAFTLDGGNQSILLAYMIAEEETYQSWRQFISYLEASQLLVESDPVYETLHSLIDMVETLYPELVNSIPEMALPSMTWYTYYNRKNNNNPALRSIRSVFYRIIFSSVDTAIFMERFMTENNEVLSKLSKYPKWNRRMFENQAISESIIKDFELNVMDRQGIRFLMLDDVVSGLYTVMIEKSKQRAEYYTINKQTDDLTPYLYSILNEYKRSKEEFHIQEQDTPYTYMLQSINDSSHLYLVNLKEQACSCGYWKQLRFPCIHAWTLLTTRKMPLEPYLEYFTCEKALKMAPLCEPVEFQHKLEQQVEYYNHAVDNPVVNQTFWETDGLEIPSSEPILDPTSIHSPVKPVESVDSVDIVDSDKTLLIPQLVDFSKPIQPFSQNDSMDVPKSNNSEPLTMSV